MSIITTSTISKSLSKDTQSIINLILDCQIQLTRQDILAYFRNHPDAASELLGKAQATVKAFPIIIRGLKEKLNSDILPSIGELDHPGGWLNVEDVFVGVAGFCHTYPYDRPYVVRAILPDGGGYEWRYIDEPIDVSRPPMRLDPGLRLYAWWKIPIEREETAADEVKSFLQAEISALTEYVMYLRDFTA